VRPLPHSEAECGVSVAKNWPMTGNRLPRDGTNLYTDARLKRNTITITNSKTAHFAVTTMALILALLLVAGCAKTISINIKTIDAKTGKPLAGVSTSWMEEHQDLILGSHRFGPTNLPPSNQDGVIRVDKLNTHMGSRFIFSCPGYAPVYALYCDGSMALAGRVSFLPRNEFVLEGNLVSVGPTNGYFLVQMEGY
jgi:hypothetical protein